LFTEIEWHSKFGSNLCKNRGEKHHRAFVKVLEGSEIYNFAFYSSVNFSCKIGRKSQLNIATRNNPRGWNESRCARRMPPYCRTRTPRQARDPRFEHHTPQDAPPHHVELPHSSAGQHRRRPASPSASPPCHAHACQCRRRTAALTPDIASPWGSGRPRRLFKRRDTSPRELLHSRRADTAAGRHWRSHDELSLPNHTVSHTTFRGLPTAPLELPKSLVFQAKRPVCRKTGRSGCQSVVPPSPLAGTPSEPSNPWNRSQVSP
jgi:hypothetical protein